MLRYLFISFLFLHCTFSYSQYVQRATFFSTGGNYGNNGSLQLQSNIGELMSDTYTSGSSMISQGFVQPDLSLITIVVENPFVEAKAFPNPVLSQLTLELNLTEADGVVIDVYDIFGKKEAIDFTSNYSSLKSSFILNLEKLSSGIYFIRIGSQKNKFNKIFKVNKI